MTLIELYTVCEMRKYRTLLNMYYLQIILNYIYIKFVPSIDQTFSFINFKIFYYEIYSLSHCPIKEEICSRAAVNCGRSLLEAGYMLAQCAVPKQETMVNPNQYIFNLLKTNLRIAL